VGNPHTHRVCSPRLKLFTPATETFFSSITNPGSTLHLSNYFTEARLPSLTKSVWKEFMAFNMSGENMLLYWCPCLAILLLRGRRDVLLYTHTRLAYPITFREDVVGCFAYTFLGIFLHTSHVLSSPKIHQRQTGTALLIGGQLMRYGVMGNDGCTGFEGRGCGWRSVPVISD